MKLSTKPALIFLFIYVAFLGGCEKTVNTPEQKKSYRCLRRMEWKNLDGWSGE